MNYKWPLNSQPTFSVAKFSHPILAKWCKLLLLLSFFLGSTIHSEASHLMGGEVVYEYLDDTGPGSNIYRYKVTYTTYVWCGSGSAFSTSPPSSLTFGVYDGLTNALFNSYTVSLTSTTNISPNLPSGCNVAGISNLCIFYAKYEVIINVPNNIFGYTIHYNSCCRNANILNLQNPGGTSQAISCKIPSTQMFNNSAIFTDTLVPYICKGDTTSIINNAYDPDGDRLEYSFTTPMAGSPPPASPVSYNGGYSELQPFGAGGYATVNASTGLTSYMGLNNGNYVVSVLIKEWRTLPSGVETLVNTTTREIQFIIGDCPPNNPPQFSSSSVDTAAFIMDEGESMCFDILAFDADGDNVTITSSGAIIDGTGGYTGPLATLPNASGSGFAATQFCWTTGCGFPGTYFATVTIQDDGCPPKTQSYIYTFAVTPFEGPDEIFGAETVCEFNLTESYYVASDSNATYSWAVTGGTITSGTTNDTVTVLWSPGSGTISLDATNIYGCIDTISKNITILSIDTLEAGPDTVICDGDAANLSASGSSSGYSWTPATGLNNASISNPIATPSTTQLYFVSGTNGCFIYDSVAVGIFGDVTNAGNDLYICSGLSDTLGSDSIPGFTYSWSPATGLSDALVSNPEVTLTYTGTSTDTVDYILTATSIGFGCTAIDTVRVIVNSVPVSDAGPDTSFCSGGSAPIGTSNTAGYSYLWSPATGISDSSLSNPTVSLINLDTIIDTLIYVVTTSVDSCSVNDTVTIIVYPAPFSAAGPDLYLCSADSDTIGSTPIGGFTYQWTPTAGLSDSTIANPVVTLSNLSISNDTTEFTVLATSGFGCVSTDSVLVIVNYVPVSDAGGDTSFCSGGTATIGAATTSGYSYLWSPTAGLSDSTLADPTITLNNADTISDTLLYVVTTTVDSCSTSDTVQVIVLPLPYTDAGPDLYFCSADSDTVGTPAIGGYTYAWLPTTGLSDPNAANPISALTNPLITNDTTVYILTVTSGLGCIDEDTVAVVVNHLPISDAGPDRTFCSGDSDILGTATTVGYTYAWAPSNGLSDSTLSNPSISLINTDTIIDTVMYIVTTTVDSCSTTDTTWVIVHPGPLVDAGPDLYMCSADADTIGSATIGGYAYLWSPTNGLSDSTVSNPEVSLTNPGIPNDTTEYMILVTTGFGCTDTDSVLVIINHLPISEAGPDVAFCSGIGDSLGTNSTAGYTYLWNPGNGLSDSTIADPAIILLNADTITDTIMYYVTTTVDSCTTLDSVQVIVLPLPLVDAGPDLYMCSGDADTIGSVTIGGYTYLWNPTNGLSDSTVSNPEVSLTNPGIPNDTTEYIINVTTGFGCSLADSVLVIINHLPISDAGPDVAFCSGIGDSLGTDLVAGYTYLWSPGTGLSDSTASDPTIILINADTIADTIMYYVTTTVDSCSTLDSVQVIVNALPFVDAGPDLYMCSGDADTIGSATIGGYTYLWNPTNGLSDSTVSNPEVSLTNPGIPNDTTEYIINVTTGFGCSLADSVLVIINHLPISDAGPNVTFCSGIGDSLGADLVAGYTYLWSPGTGLSDSTASDPAIILINADTIADTIMYYVTTTVDSCSTLDSVRVIVNPSPFVDGGPDLYLCSADSDSIGTPAISGYSYLWIPITGLTNPFVGNPGISLTNLSVPNDTTSYLLTVSTGVGCVGQDTVDVVVNHVPSSEAGADVSFCSGDSVVLGTGTTIGYVYEWSPTNGLSDSTISNPEIILVNADTITDTIMYYVTTTVDSCNTMDSVQVIVYPTPTVNAGNDTGFCSGDSVGLGAPAKMNYTYTWSPVTGLSDSTLSNPTVTLINTDTVIDTTFYVVIAVDTISGCVLSDTIRILSYPLPQTPEIFGAISICPGADSLSYYLNGANQGSVYNWSITGAGTVILGQGTDSILVNWDTTTVWQIITIESDSNTCVSDTAFLDGSTNPDLEPPAPLGLDTLCGDSVNGIIYSTPNANGSVYNWYVSGGIITSGNGTNSITVTWDSLGTGYVWFDETSITTDTSCTGTSDSLPVEVFTVPVDSPITGDFVICQFDSASLYEVVGLSGSFFTWIVGPDTLGSGFGLDTLTIAWDSAGTFILTVVELAPGNCINQVEDTITVYPKPFMDSIIGDTAICFDINDLYNYHINGLSGSTYSWTVNGGTIVSTPLNNDSISVRWDSVVFATISVVETSADSCVGDTVFKAVSVYQVPQDSTIDGGFVYCEDSLSFIYSITGLPGSSFIWLVDGDTIASGVGADTISVVWDTAGTYVITAIENTVSNCSDTLRDTVIVYAKPTTSAIIGDTAICFDTADSYLYYITGFTGSTYDWAVNGGTLVDTTQINNDSITVHWDSVVAGTITVVETSADSCLGDTVTLDVLVSQPPVDSSIEGTYVFCEDTLPYEYSFTALPGSYISWTLNGDSILAGVDEDTVSLIWDTAGVYVLTVIEVTATNCTDTLTDTITVYPKPTIDTIIGDNIICHDTTDTILYYVTGFSGSSYVWSVGNGTIISTPLNNDSILVMWDTLGIGDLSVVEISPDSCWGDTVVLTVSLFQIPVDSTIEGTFVFCEDTLPFDYSFTALPGSYISWTLDGDSVLAGIDEDTVSLVWDTAGIYVLTVIEVTANNCSDTLTDTITVYPKPTIDTIFGDYLICHDTLDTILYYVTGFGGSSFVWSIGNGTIISSPLNNDSILVMWDTLGFGDLSVVEISPDSCWGDTVTLAVSLFQLPIDSTIEGSYVFCEDTLAFDYSFTALPGSYISWTVDGDSVLAGVDEDTVTIVWDTAGIYVLTVVEVTANNCSDTLIDTITVYPKPTIDTLFGDKFICHDTLDTVLYYVNGFGGSSFVWSIGNGNIISTPLNNDSIWVMWDTLGIGDLSVVEISPDSCWGDTVRLTIFLYEIPTADSIEGLFEMCQYTKGETYTVNGLPGSSYLWNIPGGFNVVDDSSNTITVDWDSAGSFNLTVVEISAAGCAGDTLDSVVVINPYPITILLSGDTNVCPPFNFDKLYEVFGYDSSTYVWTVIGGVIDTGQGTSSILVDWDTTGIGSVSVVEITKDSCLGDTVGWPNIILDSPGLIMNVVSDGELEDTEVEIKWDVFNSSGFPDSVTILRRLNFTSNLWMLEAEVDALDLSYIDQGRLTSDYSFEYQLVGLNACLDTIATNIHNTVLLNGTPEESVNTIDLIWNEYLDWDNGVDHYEIWRKLDDEPDFTFYEDAGLDTTYHLTSGDDGFIHCYRILAVENGGNSEVSWSNELCVEFLHLLSIPTVITPNGNGLNDDWRILNIEYYPEVSVEIFNRWGQSIFYSSGYPQNWDGTFEGKELPVGVFYYVIDIKREGIEVYTGNVSILHRE